MERFSFTSQLTVDQRESLEKVLYFNPQQEKVISAISQVISGYGLPEICEEDGSLKIVIDGLPGLQCLFAHDHSPRNPRLAGLVLFFREEIETLVILHVAVKEQYSSTGASGDEKLVSRLVGKVMEIGRRLRGVEAIRFAYRDAVQIPVRSASPSTFS